MFLIGFIIVLIVGLSFLLFTTKERSKFELRDETVFFYKGKKSIQYSNIISLERDMPGSFAGWLTDISYVVTYYDETGKTNSFRFTKTSIDDVKWDKLKRIVLTMNPTANIDENILKIN